jgi:hypothetical protein
MSVAERRAHPPIRTAALLICTRDRPQALADCLASCAAVAGPPALKIVVCVADNNERPQEDAIRIVGAHLGLDLRYGHEPERGYASVRNLALELALAAGADIGVFMDDDSTAEAGLITAHAAALDRYGADAVLGRIEGLSQRPREGRRVWKAGTGNLSLRRWVFAPVSEGGAGLRFDPRLNLLGFEDWEFSGDLVSRGGVIYQSTGPVSISRPGVEATPNSAERAFADRRAFAIMEGRNEIAVTRMRHGFGAAAAKVVRRSGPLLLRGLGGLAAAPLSGVLGRGPARSQSEVARLRLAKAVAGIAGLWRPGFERPAARRGELIEVRG